MTDQASGRLAELRSGWRVLLGATLGAGLGVSSIPFYTAGVFVPELERAFGWSRAQLSVGSLVAMATLAAASPVAGRLIDRRGVLGPTMLSMTALIAGFVLLAVQPGSFALYLMILAAQSALASSASPIAYTRAVNARFDSARGLALGITLAGVGLAAAGAPSLVTWGIERFGWRAAYAAIALLLTVASPVIILLLRTDPVAIAPRLSESAITARLRDGPFAHLLATFIILAVGLSGLVLHLAPMLRDLGMTPLEAAGVQGVMGAFILIGRLVIGWALDRFFAPYVAAIVMVATAGGLVILGWGGTAYAIPAAAMLGFSMGAEVDLIGYLVARYWPLGGYGRVYGLLFAGFLFGTGLSPVFITQLVASGGGYRLALYGCAACVLISALAFARLPQFAKPATA
ncbi:MFS transporter [Sphingomonas sp.]|uniref:MFS transporter n=1 Tax=Sphingomonas sp. TaxID=28214 RepID=UPI0031D0523D